MWRLAVVGVLLEGCWVALAALSYPLSDRPGYVRSWTALLGAVWEPFAWLSWDLQLLVPASLTGSSSHATTLVGFFVALLLASVLYLVGIRIAASTLISPRATARMVVAFSILFLITLWCVPVTLTTDLASYVIYGRVAAVYGANPFTVPPGTFATDPLLPWIASKWWTVPSRYGPLWVDLSWLVSRLTAEAPAVVQVITYRALGSVAFLATLAVATWLLRRLLTPSSRLPTLVAFVWSPLLLLQIGGDAHNDGLGLLLLLLGFACLAFRLGKRAENWAWLGALTLFALAALVKVVPAPVLLFGGLAWARVLPNGRQRWRWLGGSAVFIALVTLLLDAPWLLGQLTGGEQATAGLAEDYAHSLIDVPAAWFAAHVLDRAGQNVLQARQIARIIFFIPAVGVFTVLVAFEVRRVWRNAQADDRLGTIGLVAAASTRTLLAFIVLVSTQVQPWYFAWPATTGLLLGWRDMTARVAIAYGLVFSLVVIVREETGQGPIDPLLIVYAVLPLALPGWAWARRRWSAGDRLDVRPELGSGRVRV